MTYKFEVEPLGHNNIHRSRKRFLENLQYMLWWRNKKKWHFCYAFSTNLKTKQPIYFIVDDSCMFKLKPKWVTIAAAPFGVSLHTFSC